MDADRSEPLHILLVTKHLAMRRRLQELLRDRTIPMTLHAVTRGEEILAFLHQGRPDAQTPLPDVIFLDLELPEKDRGHVLAEIHNAPALRDLPVVFFSGAECPHAHLAAAGLVAASLTHSLKRAECMKLLEQLLRRP